MAETLTGLDPIWLTAEFASNFLHLDPRSSSSASPIWYQSSGKCFISVKLNSGLGGKWWGCHTWQTDINHAHRNLACLFI